MKRLFFASYPFLLFGLLISIFFRPITSINEDLGRHILLGNIIISTHFVPTTNLLSYTFPHYQFVNTTWLYEVFVALLEKNLGMNAVLFASSVLAIMACVIQYLFAIRRFSKLPVYVISTFFVVLLSLRTDVRPEVFSMLFISLFVVLLYQYFEKPTWKIFLLIPFEALWVNMHIYFFAGPIILAIFIIGSFNGRFSKTIKQLLLVFTGVLATTILNPNGIKGALFPFLVLQNYGFPVVENQTPFTLFNIYQNPAIFLPAISVVSVFLMLILGRKKVTRKDVLLIVCFGVLAIVNFRNVLLFVFTTYIFTVSQLEFVLKKYRIEIKKLPQSSFKTFYPLSIFFVAVLIVKSISVHGVGSGVIEYWKGSVDFLLQNKISGPLYNDFNIGGYLSSRIYPKKVFVDNRPEAYPKKFFTDFYLPMQKNSELFKALDRKYKFNIIIVSHYDGTNYRNSLLQYFVGNPEFTLVYLDSYAMILVRNSLENQQIIQRYQIKKDKLLSDSTDDRQALFRNLLFLEKVGWVEKKHK